MQKRGLEPLHHPPFNRENQGISELGAAKCAALDDGLAELVDRWPSLPAVVREAIIDIARRNHA
jgi:hypothetical protein